MPTTPDRLYLFDIDGTLLVTGGAGIRAMEIAGQDLFGPSFTTEGLEFAGCLDPVLLTELLIRNGVAVTPDNHQRLRARYTARLPEQITGAPATRALPGVHDALDALRARDDCTLGLLTGNFADTGQCKLRCCRIDPDLFTVRVWGDDSPHHPPTRDHLPPVALDRYNTLRGRRIDPAHTVIIGDTPHDIRCATVSGCRAIGVATGKYSVDTLRSAGAHAALSDLSDTDALVDLLSTL